MPLSRNALAAELVQRRAHFGGTLDVLLRAGLDVDEVDVARAGLHVGGDELGDRAGGAEGRVTLEAFERQAVRRFHAARDLRSRVFAGWGDAGPELHPRLDFVW